ncbi:MAG TPA: lipocalin-like domain-containing protein [Anaeromyxobacteraceae bacterium]|nr:lipocalin-like domain-containing protein [Anaeromyxobacteraceae bacterium]
MAIALLVTATPNVPARSSAHPNPNPNPFSVPVPRDPRPTSSASADGGEGERPSFLPADPAHAWSFPRDHFARPGHRNEWWYFTGILGAADGRRFGYQLTFFKVGILPSPQPFASRFSTSGAVMAHAAVTELATGRHRFAEVLWRDAPLLAGFGAPPGPGVVSAQAPPGTPGRWTLDLDGSTWRLRARDDGAGLALDLAATPSRPLVLEGPNGYSRKAAAEGYASEYYSQTRLATEGTLLLDGRAVPVRGESWMDREVGSSALAPEQAGWDWFALRLADGRDLMLYVLRRADGAADWRSATLVSPDGKATFLADGDWRLRATGRWTSPATGAAYPSGWRVEVPAAGLALDVTPLVAAAENRSRRVPGLFYWEGPVEVRSQGRPAGEGYVELTGRGVGSRPPL